MKSLKILIYLLLIFFFAGCVNRFNEGYEDNTPPVTSPTLTFQELVKSTPLPTEPIHPTASPIPTQNFSSLTIPSVNKSEQNVDTIAICQDSNNNITSSVPPNLPGYIIYQDITMQNMKLAGGNPFEFSELPLQGNGKIYFLGLSNDEEWMAFTSSGFFNDEKPLSFQPSVSLFSRNRQFETRDVDVSIFQQMVKKFHASRLSGWRSSTTHWVGNHLIPMAIALRTDSSTNLHTDVIYGLLDPFQGEWQNDIYSSLPGWKINYYVAFSPDMERALYASPDFNQVILLDITNQKILWQNTIQNFFTPGREVYQWSLDGSRSAYLISIETGITTLLRDGTEVPLSKLLDKNSSNKYYLKEFKLSPNGYFVALLYQVNNNELRTEKYLLFIYDFQTQQYVLQCQVPLNSFNQMYWSPDNHYLTGGIRNFDLTQEEEPLYVFDTQKGVIYKLSNDGSAAEWSSKFAFTPP